MSLSANSWPLTGQLAAASDDADAFDAQFQVHRSQTCEKCTYSSNRQDWMAVASLSSGGSWLQPQSVYAVEWWLGVALVGVLQLP